METLKIDSETETTIDMPWKEYNNGKIQSVLNKKIIFVVYIEI